MEVRSAFFAVVSLMALGGVANADDHLFNAKQHGLRSGSTASGHNQAFTTNRAGRSGDLAPGQGSPFTGEERGTPSTATGAAQTHGGGMGGAAGTGATVGAGGGGGRGR